MITLSHLAAIVTGQAAHSSAVQRERSARLMTGPLWFGENLKVLLWGSFRRLTCNKGYLSWTHSLYSWWWHKGVFKRHTAVWKQMVNKDNGHKRQTNLECKEIKCLLRWEASIQGWTIPSFDHWGSGHSSTRGLNLIILGQDMLWCRVVKSEHSGPKCTLIQSPLLPQILHPTIPSPLPPPSIRRHSSVSWHNYVWAGDSWLSLRRPLFFSR